MRSKTLILQSKPKKKKIFLVLLTSLSFIGAIFILAVPQAWASLAEAVLSPQKAIQASVGWGVDIAFGLMRKVVALLAALADFVLRMDNFAKNEAVELGWRILRDFANMSFVMILLIMAFATIFGFESYGMKKLLYKLVIAALLLNFSLTIAGFVVDVSQYLCRFFIKAGVSGTSVSAALAKGLNLGRLFEATANTDWAASLASGLLVIIEGSVLGTIVLLVAGFAFGALALMLFIRVIMISILLVVSPVIWIAWILPSTKEWWHKWWTHFLKWTFFAPIYCFFLYLALVIIQKNVIFDTFKNKTAELAATTSGIGFAASFFNPASIISYILIIGLMIAGLMVANSFSITGAKGAMKIVNRGKDWGINKAKAGALWAPRKAREVVEEKVAPAAAGAALGAAARLPGVGPMFEHERQIATAERAEAKRAKQRAQINNVKDSYRAWTDENIIRAYASATPQERAALLELAAERGIVHKLDQTRVKQDVPNMSKYGANKKDVIKSDPRLAENSLELFETFQKFKPADLAAMSSDAWKNDRIKESMVRMLQRPQGFTTSHLKVLADRGDPVAVATVRDLFKDPAIQARLRPDIKDFLKSPAGQQYFGTTVP